MLSTSHNVFIEVARQLSFSKATQTLFMSQPSISNHIKMLEVEYKNALFNRKGTTISLTPSGKILFRHLQDALKIQRQLVFELSTLQNVETHRGNLKLVPVLRLHYTSFQKFFLHFINSIPTLTYN